MCTEKKYPSLSFGSTSSQRQLNLLFYTSIDFLQSKISQKFQKMRAAKRNHYDCDHHSVYNAPYTTHTHKCVNTGKRGPPIVPLLFRNTSHMFCTRLANVGLFPTGDPIVPFVISPRFECLNKLTHTVLCKVYTDDLLLFPSIVPTVLCKVYTEDLLLFPLLLDLKPF